MKQLWKILILTATLMIPELIVGQGTSLKTEIKIGIVYTSPHPVINEIISGFKDVVQSRYPNAKFTERHANGNSAEYGTAVLSVLSNEPTLIAPITTPISKITLEQSRGRIPVIFMGVTDPVGAGLVDSIELPRKSTGSSDLCPCEALLNLTRQILPNAKRIGVPYNPTDQPAVFGMKRFHEKASSLGFSVTDRQVTSRDEIATEVKGLAGRVDAVLIGSDNLMMENPDLAASAAATEKRPLFACDDASVEKGAVAGVSVSYREVGRAAGELAIQVLNGANPGNLPVRVISSGNISVNKKAACLAGTQLPQDILSKAKVYESGYICTERPATNIQIFWVIGGFVLVMILLSIFLLRYKKQSAYIP